MTDTHIDTVPFGMMIGSTVDLGDAGYVSPIGITDIELEDRTVQVCSVIDVCLGGDVPVDTDRDGWFPNILSQAYSCSECHPYKAYDFDFITTENGSQHGVLKA